MHYLRCSVHDDTASDVICLTETKLSDKIDSSEIALPGYDVIRHDRNRQVANIECCVIVADLKQNCTVCICCVYKPPFTRLPEWESALSHMLNALSLDGKPLILTGDFNVNLLHDNSFAEKMKTVSNEPTRITKNSATLIDYIYCSHKSMIYYILGVC